MTSIPASRSARAMIFAPRSWPSRPGFAITTRIFRAMTESLRGERPVRPVDAPPGEPAAHPEHRRDEHDQREEPADRDEDPAGAELRLERYRLSGRTGA